LATPTRATTELQSTAAPGRPGAQRLHPGGERVDRTVQVDPQQLARLRGRRAVQRRDQRAAYAVRQQRRRLAPGLTAGGHRLGRTLGRARVDRQMQLGGQVRQALGVAAGHRHPQPAGTQPGHQRLADAAGAAGDQRGLKCFRHHASPAINAGAVTPVSNIMSASARPDSQAPSTPSPAR
jgi:hypothetical protein